ncbi:MAG: DUF1566 domain-containing protein [Spirochaetaceae bacterium]|jgi:hypothetical protein|nr:DUF1566 domain-containing protein [Spirochaetaceae bacterium]
MIKKRVFFVAVWAMAVVAVFAGGGSEPDPAPAPVTPAARVDPAVQERFDYLDRQLQAKPAEGTVILTEANSGSSGMDLDAAIREAAAQMEAKIPAKTMLALVSVASPSTAFSTQVLTRLESAIVSSGKLVVVDRANLDKIREEQGFQLSGEVDDESAKSIGKLLGAGAIVTGSLADLGDVYSLTLKAINIETATVAVSYLADLAKSVRVETLLASGGGGTAPRRPAGGSTAPAGQAAAPTPAAPPAPTTYKVGDAGPAGGIVFYDKGGFSDDWRYLEAAPASTEIKSMWLSSLNSVGGTGLGIGRGKKNTELIVAFMRKNGQTGAAEYCAELYINGFNDWFLPSNGELNLMYQNLQVNDLGGFKDDRYWSSSEIDNVYAWEQNFSNGVQYNFTGKHYSCSVRAVRQF